MKTKLAILMAALCGVFGTLPLLGQTTYTWTGGGDGTNLAVAANWGGTLPSTASSDTGEWNGTVSGNLVLHYNNGAWASGYNQNGVNLYLAGTQTGSIKIITDLASPSYLAIQNVTIDPGAGSFILGDTNPATIVWLIGRPTSAVHAYVNNSTNAAIINGRVRMAAGGGLTYTMDFSGSGDWDINNYLVNDNGPGMNVQVDGPGTMYWNASLPNEFVGANGINTPIVINGGTLDLTGNHPKINSQAFTLGGTLEFDAPSQSQSLSGVISGAGSVVVGGGTLTLSGASTYFGDTYLNGGELVVAGTETAYTSGPLGVGGFIHFDGGTLGYSLNNTYDYSDRFSTDTNQAYRIDTAGQNVTYESGFGLGSVGGTLTKLGAGTLTLMDASTYTGNTTVQAGKLVFGNTLSSTNDITVDDGAALGVTETGTPVTPNTLTLGSSTGCTLEFNSVSSTTTAPLQANTIVSPATVTINVNSGTFTSIGQTFPLLTWTSGSAPAVQLGSLIGGDGTLSTNGNAIDLTITAIAFVWKGNNGNTWDSTTPSWSLSGNQATVTNGEPVLFDDSAVTPTVTIGALVEPSSVTVNNTASGYYPNFTITSSSGNDIGGNARLTMHGSGTLTLAGGANTYTGVTTASAGIISVSTLANGGSASDIGAASSDATNLVLNGGTLQYTGGGASIDRLFTLTANGGAIDGSGTGSLVLNNPGAVNVIGKGTHTLTLTGSDTNGETLAAVLPDGSGGAVALTKSGNNTWILTGTNTYSGGTTIAGGTLQVGAGGQSGSLGSGDIVDNGQLAFNRSGTLIVPGAINGAGSVANNGSGTVILEGNNNYNNATYVNAGTLQVGNGGPSGSLFPNHSIVVNTNATFIFDSTTPFGISGYLVGVQGAGNLIVGPGCSFSSIDNNTYTGWTLIDPGATFTPCYGNEGLLVSSVITNNGTLFFTRQDNFVFGYTNNIVGSGKVVKDNNNQNTGDITLAGNNTYTGGTWIAGGGIVLAGYNLTTIVTNITVTSTNYTTNTFAINGGSIVGPVIFTNTSTSYLNNRYLLFNRNHNFTFANDIIGAVTDGSLPADSGRVEQMGVGVVALTGNNSWPGTTTIDTNSTLQIGAGGTTGNIGTGAVTDNGTLVFDRSDNVTFANDITGAGALVQNGPGTVTLTSTNNTYGGVTTVSNGTLVISGQISAGTVQVGNDLDVDGGTVVAGGLGTIVTMNVGAGGVGSLNISNGTVVVSLNTSLGQPNTVYAAPYGLINASGGTLKLINNGPALTVGEKFYVFDQLVPGGNAMTIVSPGYTFANNLATDGSVQVTGVVAGPGTFTNPTGIVGFKLNGSDVVIQGTNGQAGAAYYLLQSTNAALPLSQWVPVATNVVGADGNYTFTGTNVVTPGGGQQFYILSNTNNH